MRAGRQLETMDTNTQVCSNPVNFPIALKCLGCPQLPPSKSTYSASPPSRSVGRPRCISDDCPTEEEGAELDGNGRRTDGRTGRGSLFQMVARPPRLACCLLRLGRSLAHAAPSLHRSSLPDPPRSARPSMKAPHSLAPLLSSVPFSLLPING